MSAKLVLLTGNVSGDGTTAKMSLFPMLTAWSDTATWDSLVGGVSTNGVEASSTSEFGVTPTTRDIFAIFDVTKSLQQWVLDPTKNNGWLLNPSGTDGSFDSSEFATLGLRPMLEVTLRNLVHPWQNPTLTLDTDNNGNVEALDVLQIVNSLNSLGPHTLSVPAVSPDAPPPFLDPSGDDFVSALDVLMVVNYLNSHGLGVPALARPRPNWLSSRAHDRLAGGSCRSAESASSDGFP